MESPSSVALAALVEPWLDTLRGLGIYVAPADATADGLRGGGVWLQWSRKRDVSLARCIQAVELFVLLAWADRDAWQQVAGSLDSSYFTTPAPHVRVLGYGVSCYHKGDPAAFCAPLIARDATQLDGQSDYCHVRDVLESVTRAKSGDGATKEIPVRLRLAAELQPFYTDDDSALAAIVSLATMQRALDTQAFDATNEPMCSLADFRSRLRLLEDKHYAISSVMEASGCYYAMSTLSEEILFQLATIWAYGVRVMDLPGVQPTVGQKEGHARAAARNGLLGIGCHGCAQRVVVPQALDNTETVALLSAVAHSSSVREVTLEFAVPRDDVLSSEHRVVQWMAYALFSTHATNAVTKLSLRCRNLTVAHVNMMRELLTADDPLEVLFPEFAESIRAHGDLRVSASRLYLDDRASDTRSNDCARSVIDLEDLRVLTQSERWWRVFAPGCGQAWVVIDQAVVSRVVSTVPIRKIRSIAEIHLFELQADNDMLVLELLRMLGSGVRKVEVSESHRLIGRIYPAVFDACTNVEEFKVCEYEADQLATIVESFVGGLSRRLKRLYVRLNTIAQAVILDVERILQALADPALAMQLQVLDVNVFCTDDDDDVLDSSVLHTALRMLQVNKTVAHLRLHLPLITSDKSAVQSLANELARHHDVLLPVPVAPLGAREKAAFLSAVWAHASRVTSQFDRRIVSTIFEFAPDRRRRRVEVSTPSVW